MMDEEEYVDSGAAAQQAPEKPEPQGPSLEAQRNQLDAAAMTSGAMPSGWAAQGYSAEFAKRLDDENERVRKEMFADNPKGFENYLGYARFAQAAQLEGAMRYEAAQLRHAATEESQAMAADMLVQARRTVSEQGMAGQTEKWAAIEAAQKDRSALDEKATRRASDLAAAAGKGPAGDSAREAIAAGLQAAKAEHERQYAARTGAAESAWEANSDRLYAHIGESMNRLYAQVERNAVNNGDTPLVAKAKAEQAVRAAAVGLLNGMVEDGNHDLFKRWRDKLGAVKTQDIADDGAGNATVVDAPMRRWCLLHEDLNKADEKYNEALYRAQRRQRLLSQADDTRQIGYVESLRSKASRILHNPVMSADDDGVVNQILDGLDSVVNMQGASEKAITRARSAIEHILSERDARAQRETRVAAKISKMRTKEEAERLYDQLVAAGDVTRSVMLVTVNNDGGEECREVTADIRHLKRYVINEARESGLLTGQVWSDRLRELDETTEQDLKEQFDALAAVRSSLNLHVVTKDEDSDTAKSGFTKKKALERKDAFDALIELDRKAGAYVTKNKNATWRWNDSGGVGHDLTADQVNMLFNKAAEFQRLHKDAKTSDLVEFMTRTLAESVRDADIERYSDKSGWSNFMGLGKAWDYVSGGGKMRTATRDIGAAATIVASQMLGDANTVRGFNQAMAGSSRVVIDAEEMQQTRDDFKRRVEFRRSQLEARAKELKEKRNGGQAK